MFEHLDDNTPHRTGTTPQLAAVRNRARQISSERRRNRLAVGSATLAVTAVASGVAVAGTVGGSRTASGQPGSGSSAGEKSAAPKPMPADKASIEAKAKKTFDPSDDAAKASKLASEGLAPANGSEGPVSPKPVCDPALPSLAGVAAPTGYSIVDTPDQVWAEYKEPSSATVTIKVVCSPLESADVMAKDGQIVSDTQFGGHAAIRWTGDNGQIGVGWSTKAGAIYIKAEGPVASRLTIAELEAFATTVPTAH